MTITFESAYKALEAAKAAAKITATEGAHTGDAEIINLACERLVTAKAELREAHKRSYVETDKGLILKTDHEALEKLAKDNGCSLQKVISNIAGVRNGRISYLLLSNLGLKDISSLSGLTGLTYLDLSDNQISNIQALAKLSVLTVLNLDRNKISDITALAGLTALTQLRLSQNQIENILPLSGLTKLYILTLSENRKIQDISALAGLISLIELALDGNKINDLSALSELTQLDTLYLGYNQIENVSALSKLYSLTLLTLGHNQIQDISVLAGLDLSRFFPYPNPLTKGEELNSTLRKMLRKRAGYVGGVAA